MQSLAEIEKKRIAIQKAYLVSCVNSRIDDLEAAAWVLCGKRVAPGVKLYVGAASHWTQQEAEKRGVWQAMLAAGAIPLPPSCGPCIGLGAGLLEKGEVGISATNRNFKGRMGSREAQCYLASPEVVAASAIAGYITGPRRFEDRPITRQYQEFSTNGHGAESVEILPGFPARIHGRLVFIPQDNVNTDAIYGKDYTYRDDMTRDDGSGCHGELRSAVLPSHLCRGCDRRRLQLRHWIKPRAGRHLLERQRHPADHRGQFFSDLFAQCL
jgi:homoaconitate hydratase